MIVLAGCSGKKARDYSGISIPTRAALVSAAAYPENSHSKGVFEGR